MAYHKDISEYFTLPINATGNQPLIQNYFQTLVYNINGNLVNGPEKSVAMRKLLESFDAAMRAAA